MQITGIAQGTTVLILCSTCGEVATVPTGLAHLRILAHYHAHESGAV